MRSYVPKVFALLLLLAVSTACSSSRPAREPGQEEQVVRQIGETAAMTLMRTLMGRVQAALAEGGPVYAMDFCSVEAQPLTAEINEQLNGVSVKRTSFKFRNPNNAPDAYEAAALRYFEEALAAQGNLPQYYIQRVGSNEYRYYKPIVIAEGCLSCHGDPAQFSPELQQALAAEYPDDLAVGYATGDFRGVARVSLPRSMVTGQ